MWPLCLSWGGGSGGREQNQGTRWSPEVASATGGTIRVGSKIGLSPGGTTAIVAFTHSGVLVEADAKSNVPSLAPGGHGPEVGNDASEEAEVYLNPRPEAYRETPPPSRRAGGERGGKSIGSKATGRRECNPGRPDRHFGNHDRGG